MARKKNRARKDELDQIAAEHERAHPKGPEAGYAAFTGALLLGWTIVLLMGYEADLSTKFGMMAVWLVVAILQTLARRIDPGVKPHGRPERDRSWLGSQR